MCAKRWSVVHVRRKGVTRVFMQKGQMFATLPAYLFDDGSQVRVYRNKELFDKGSVEANGVVCWFNGFAKVVPGAETVKSPRMRGGRFDPLLPAHFETGDMLQVQVPTERFQVLIPLSTLSALDL